MVGRAGMTVRGFLDIHPTDYGYTSVYYQEASLRNQICGWKSMSVTLVTSTRISSSSRPPPP